MFSVIWKSAEIDTASWHVSGWFAEIAFPTLCLNQNAIKAACHWLRIFEISLAENFPEAFPTLNASSPVFSSRLSGCHFEFEKLHTWEVSCNISFINFFPVCFLKAHKKSFVQMRCDEFGLGLEWWWVFRTHCSAGILNYIAMNTKYSNPIYAAFCGEGLEIQARGSRFSS